MQNKLQPIRRIQLKQRWWELEHPLRSAICQNGFQVQIPGSRISSAGPPRPGRLSLPRGTDSFSDLHTGCADPIGKRKYFNSPRASTAAACAEHAQLGLAQQISSSVAEFRRSARPRQVGPSPWPPPEAGTPPEVFVIPPLLPGAQVKVN